MPASHEREQAIFTLAVAKPPAERAAFLEQECAGDAALRQRLEALMAAHERPDPLLEVQTDDARLRSEASARQARTTIKLDLPGDPMDDAVGQILGRYKLLKRGQR